MKKLKGIHQNNRVQLSKLIATWDILHQKSTGDMGFCDLEKALGRCGITIHNDLVDGCYPKSGFERRKWCVIDWRQSDENTRHTWC